MKGLRVSRFSVLGVWGFRTNGWRQDCEIEGLGMGFQISTRYVLWPYSPSYLLSAMKPTNCIYILLGPKKV